MAKILSMSIGKNSIHCILSGSIGNKVWVNRNGINYSRSKPVSVANPKSLAQLEHRARFTAMIKFLQPLKNFLRVGFESRTGNMSAFNAAMSCNLKMAVAGTYPEYRIDYSKVMVSRGKLPGALHPSVRLTPAGEIEFAWENNSKAIDVGRSDDKAMLVVYNPEKQEAVTIVGGNIRITGSQVIALPSHFAGDEVQCYIGFQNLRQSEVSESQYVGGIVVENKE